MVASAVSMLNFPRHPIGGTDSASTTKLRKAERDLYWYRHAQTISGWQSSFTTVKYQAYCLPNEGVRMEKKMPRHIALYCTEETDRRQYLRIGRYMDYRQLVGKNGGAGSLRSR